MSDRPLPSPSKRARGPLVLGLVLALGLLAAACGGQAGSSGQPASSSSQASSGSSTPVKGGTATFALPPSVHPTYILPLMPNAYYSNVNLFQFQQLLYRPLYWFGKGAQPVLNEQLSLALPPRYSDHDRRVTITLKPFRWADGKPVTSRDVTFWMNLLKAEKAIWPVYVPGGFPDDVTRMVTRSRAPSSSTCRARSPPAGSPTTSCPRSRPSPSTPGIRPVPPARSETTTRPPPVLGPYTSSCRPRPARPPPTPPTRCGRWWMAHGSCPSTRTPATRCSCPTSTTPEPSRTWPSSSRSPSPRTRLSTALSGRGRSPTATSRMPTPARGPCWPARATGSPPGSPGASTTSRRTTTTPSSALSSGSCTYDKRCRCSSTSLETSGPPCTATGCPPTGLSPSSHPIPWPPPSRSATRTPTIRGRRLPSSPPTAGPCTRAV